MEAGPISDVFVWAIGFAVLIPVLALPVREVPLRTAREPDRTAAAAQDIVAQDAQENDAIASL